MLSPPADALLASSPHPFRPVPAPAPRRVRPRPPRAHLFETVRLRFVTRARPRAGVPAPDIAIERALHVMLFAMFTLVFFLLPFFRAPQCMCAEPDLSDVPLVRNAGPIPDAPVIQVGHGAVLLDGQRVASLADVRASNHRIDRLGERLDDARRLYPVVHPDEEFQGDVALIAGRETEWRVLRNLAPTLERAGYTRWQMIVTVASPAAVAWDRAHRPAGTCPLAR